MTESEPEPAGAETSAGAHTNIPAFAPERALAVYGTLAPGRSNHGVVADIAGRWVPGLVFGHRYETTWSGMTGFPAFRPDPAGPAVEVHVLVSDELAHHWDRLDRFEGPGYRRREIEVVDRDRREMLGRAFVYETLT